MTTRLTPDEIEELSRAEAAATAGPWRVFEEITELAEQNNEVRVCYERAGGVCEWCIALSGETDSDGPGRKWTPETLERWIADARAIAALRNAAPSLLAMARRSLEQDAEIARLRDELSRTRQLFGTALQRLQELGEHSFDLDRKGDKP